MTTIQEVFLLVVCTPVCRQKDINIGHFEIAVFSTTELFEDCDNAFGDGFKGRDIVIEFINGAFGRSDTHSVSIEPATDIIDAPQEGVGGPFEAKVPCSPYDGEWSDLRSWWDFWFNEAGCKDPHTKEKDCNLLLTAASSGGTGGPREPVAGGAFTIADEYSSYKEWDKDPAFNKVDTVLEEVGHTLVSDMVDNDYDDYYGHPNGDGTLGHDSGRLYEHNGKYAITPIGITGDTDFNNCGDEVDKSR
jgi:hypothetical protein